MDIFSSYCFNSISFIVHLYLQPWLKKRVFILWFNLKSLLLQNFISAKKNVFFSLKKGNIFVIFQKFEWNHDEKYKDTLFIIIWWNLCSGFDPSHRESTKGEPLGVRWLAQGHHGMWAFWLPYHCTTAAPQTKLRFIKHPYVNDSSTRLLYHWVLFI